MGLHGSITPIPGPNGRVRLPVRWAPPWTPFLALLWFMALGLTRGHGLLTIPVGATLIVALWFVYRQAAAGAAKELRWSFVQGADRAEESEPR